MHKFHLRGLYVITDASLQAADQLVEQVRSALEGGANLVQYRDKSSSRKLRLEQASELATLCRHYKVPLLINDDVELALASGATGVHLGKDDVDSITARQRLGSDALIGLSCYNRWELAKTAATQPVDYIAFGRFFPSQTKPEAVQADTELVRRAKRQLKLPVAVIGGITAKNAVPLVDAGADMLAVVQAVFATANIRQAAKELAALYH